MKDGRTFEGYMHLFRPQLGWITLMGKETKLYFEEMESAITKGDRIGYNEGQVVIGDVDEIERARKFMADARKFHWEGMDENTPKQDWELAQN